MQIADRVSSDLAIHHGKPVIAGTRVPVSVAVGSLAGGMTKQDVMREYELTNDDVVAALAFADVLGDY